jgi:hypothetical protein
LKRRKYNYWQDKGLSIEGSDIKRIRYSKDQVSKVSNIARNPPENINFLLFMMQ